jgi:hypothetical protein
MISARSIHFMCQAPAASEGLHGMVWSYTVTARPWLAESRETSAVRPDKIVIG